MKNRLKTDDSFYSSQNTNRRSHHVLKGKLKSSSSKDLKGIDIQTYRKWIEYQMTTEVNWRKIEINPVKPICLFIVSNEEALQNAINWKNIQLSLKIS